jgi:hypothetical protein
MVNPLASISRPSFAPLSSVFVAPRQDVTHASPQRHRALTPPPREFGRAGPPRIVDSGHALKQHPGRRFQLKDIAVRVRTIGERHHGHALTALNQRPASDSTRSIAASMSPSTNIGVELAASTITARKSRPY